MRERPPRWAGSVWWKWEAQNLFKYGHFKNPEKKKRKAKQMREKEREKQYVGRAWEEMPENMIKIHCTNKI